MRRSIGIVGALLLVTAACGSDVSDDAAPVLEALDTSAVVTTTVAATEAPADTESDEFAEPLQWDAPPEMIIDSAATYTATLNTNLGPITLGLYPDKAPQTVNNFVFLAREGFYDGVIFHRVVPGFVIQGGDPTGTGRGGPGYSFADELNDPQPYARGIVAMANAGADTNGSQFFIVLADAGLPYQYNIFGEVTEGLEVVDAIAAAETAADRPINDIIIESVTIDGP